MLPLARVKSMLVLIRVLRYLQIITESNFRGYTLFLFLLIGTYRKHRMVILRIVRRFLIAFLTLRTEGSILLGNKHCSRQNRRE